MSRRDEDSERDLIETLLPWYATGKLNADDKTKVERYLADRPEAANMLKHIRMEREQSVLLSESLPLPSREAAERLMASLPAIRPSLHVADAGGLFDRWVAFIGLLQMRGVAAAGLLAIVLIVAQAAAITGLLVGEQYNTYKLASGAKDVNHEFALVAFVDDAKASAIATLLEEFNANIVDGPKPGGVYKIMLPAGQKSQRNALLTQLAERRDLVRIVLPSRN